MPSSSEIAPEAKGSGALEIVITSSAVVELEEMRIMPVFTTLGLLKAKRVSWLIKPLDCS